MGTITTSKRKNFGSDGGGGSGAFENSFAKGLDISEFLDGSSSGSGTATNRRTSAAEELLRIKQEEKRQREVQEQEEAKMQQALQKRLTSFTTSKPRAGGPRDSFEIGDALVRMHGTDEKTASILSRKNSRKSGVVSTRRNSAPPRRMGGIQTIRKPAAAKKSRKSKF
jgi:hypothetical protein